MSRRPSETVTDPKLIIDAGASDTGPSLPQLILVMLPNGKLATEVPGPNGARRRLELKPGQVESTILEIMRGRIARRIEVGLDGSPTQHQVRHWQQHPHYINGKLIKKNPATGYRLSPDVRCPFCISEGHIKPQPKRKPQVEKLDAIRLALISRGYVEDQPGHWRKPKHETVRVSPTGSITGAQRGKWSREAVAALIETGTIEFARLGKKSVETVLRRDGIEVRRISQGQAFKVLNPGIKSTGPRTAKRPKYIEVAL